MSPWEIEAGDQVDGGESSYEGSSSLWHKRVFIIPERQVHSEKSSVDLPLSPYPPFLTPNVTSNYRTYMLRRVHTEDTVSDLPGPGRGIDKVYQVLGRALERWANHTADRLGFGPAAAVRTILKGFEGDRVSRTICGTGVGDTRLRPAKKGLVNIHKENKRVKNTSRGCAKLVRYTRSNIPKNQRYAIDNIVTLVAKYPFIREYFLLHGAEESIETAIDDLLLMQDASWMGFCGGHTSRDYDADTLDGLLSSSRKALICVQDNELNRLAKILVRGEHGNYATASAEDSLQLEHNWRTYGSEFLQYLDHPQLSFLALRYLNNSVFFQRFIYDYRRGSETRKSLFKQLIGLVRRLDPTCRSDQRGQWTTVTSVRGTPGFMFSAGAGRFGAVEWSQPVAIEPNELVICAERTLAIGWMVSLSDDNGDDHCRLWLRELENAIDSQQLDVVRDQLTYGNPREVEDAGVAMYIKINNTRFCYMKGVDGPRIEQRVILN